LCRGYTVFGYALDGGNTELLAAPEYSVIRIPDGLAFEQAAAAPLVFLTAWHMLMARAKLQPGEDVLVLAASSGVGMAAIQIAKMFQCRVISTATIIRTPRHRAHRGIARDRSRYAIRRCSLDCLAPSQGVQAGQPPFICRTLLTRRESPQFAPLLVPALDRQAPRPADNCVDVAQIGRHVPRRGCSARAVSAYGRSITLVG